MATKPTDLGRWANAGGAIVIPTSGKKDVGYAPSEKPPAQFENWRGYVAYLWHKFLDDSFTAAGELRHGEHELTISALNVKTVGGGAAWNTATADTGTMARFATPLGATTGIIELPFLRAGDRITDVRIWAKGDGAQDPIFNFQRVHFPSGVPTLSALASAVTLTDLAATWQHISIPLTGSTYTVAAGDSIRWQGDGNVGIFIGPLTIKWDRPLP